MNRILNNYSGHLDKESNDFKEHLSRLIRRLENNNDYQICGEELLWIFNESWWPQNINIRNDLNRIKKSILSSYTGGPIQGFYNHRSRKITIYLKNLCSQSYEDILSVFVHEVFHALHLFYLDKVGCNEKISRYYHSVVLESLATYFQIKFLEYNGMNCIADKIKNSLLRDSPIFNPYCGCQWLLMDTVTFDTIFSLSTQNFEKSLRNLVDKYDADIIMQKEKV